MRRVLVLGGTGWLGRTVVERLVSDGDDVTCLARGESGGVPAGARLVAVDRRSDDAYAAVHGDWDEVVEIAYEPDLVGPALDALAARAAHWTLISSVSAYAGNTEPGAGETAALVEPEDLSRYPDAKVAAERASARRLGDRLLIARPGLIVGPGDPSDRFGYWPARFTRPGPVLAPSTTGRHVQVIDVDDLATWIAAAARDDVTGTVNAVGAIVPMRDAFCSIAEIAGFGGDVVEVSDDTLQAHDVRYWAGPRSLPLWLPSTEIGFAQRSGRRFLETGGHLTPLADTAAKVLSDEMSRGVARDRRSGLSPVDEAVVLASAR
ncbi:NAD-dependent epimerase/dehydratase family protein [Microbacterium sp. cf332]|uniref:NAD-dependent epimerase/dehydratase family protein n=1 Tax=Microbacterium sp. cf332 TaxID=1761804 RepID=UPI0008826365|nr:NAD-dependent epimerase/dehydratase family protein [Microbacterium sp. cf332]SDQ48788.1 Nucleoside-diphosphate-sugar epimerase [Microbacterium sp. cf332]